MGLDLRLEAKLGLIMTPRLQQAIKLLQYNALELAGHVQEAILENPTLEVSSDSAGSDGPSDREVALRDAADRSQKDLVEQGNGNEGALDWEAFQQYVSDRVRGPRMDGGSSLEELPPIETNLTYSSSLADHLLFQLHMLRCSEDERRLATLLILNLDDRGYLTVSLQELAQQQGVEPGLVEDALEIVQQLDPIGCGSRDLAECLRLQARHLHPGDDNFVRIIDAHLGNLERKKYEVIARELELDVEDVIEYHRMIQDFEPQPGRSFGSEEPRYITPDVYVDKQQGEWQVQVNDEGIPSLKINVQIQRLMRKASKEDKLYLQDKLRSAEFLIRSLHKRRSTIRRVMESILKFQRDFFEHGVERLRPLVLQDVADDIGVHMSTVSRVTTNKYVHTPHGTFELKYFFSAAVKQDTGGDLAAEAIKNRLRQLVAGEDARRPLSDQALADLLKKEGINVARRTVAKYREQLNILPSSSRKRMF